MCCVRFFCLMAVGFLAASCAHLDLSNTAQQIGESQHRENCMAEFEAPGCPRVDEMPHDWVFER